MAEFFVGIGHDEVLVLGLVVGLEIGNGFGEATQPRLLGIGLHGLFRIFVVATETFALGLEEGVHDLEALESVVLLGLGLGQGLRTEFGGKGGEVHAVKQLLDGGSTHLGVEGTAFVGEVLILGFINQSVRFEVGVTRIDDNILFVVDDVVEVLGRKVQEGADDARLVTDEPGVGQRNSKFNVAHVLTAHVGVSHFHAATVTDDTLVTDALELTAVTFPVLHRSKDLFAEKTILFRLEGTVVDGFGLGHFTMGPAADHFRSGEVNRNIARIVAFNFFDHITYLHWSEY